MEPLFCSSGEKESYAGLLLSVLLNICKSEYLIANIFEAIAPYVSHISVKTAEGMMNYFESALATHQSIVPIFLRAFASIVTKRNNGENIFAILILQKGRLFKDMKPTDETAEQLAIITKFLKEVRRLIGSTKETQIAASDLMKILHTMNVEDLFPQEIHYAPNCDKIKEEIQETWSRWTNAMFKRCCRNEIEAFEHIEHENQAV